MFRNLLLTAASLLLLTGTVSAAVYTQDAAATAEDEAITLNVRGVQLGQVLEMISVKKKVNIVTGVDTKVGVTANFYDASLEEALDWVLNPLGLGWMYDGKVYHVLPLDELDIVESPLVHHLVSPNYIAASELQKFVLPLLSPRGSVVLSDEPTVGIPSNGEDAGGNSSAMQDTLLIIDQPDVIERIDRLVDRLDVRPRQVLVKATLIEVRLDETNRWGVDLAALSGGPHFSDFDSLGDLANVFTDGDPLEAGTMTGTTSGFTSPDGDGLRIGYVGSSISMFVEALQLVADTNVLANTEVLALNKQRGELIIGGRLGYFGATTVSDGISQQAVEFLEVGTQLRFRPFIGDDGFVRLEIHPQRSSGVVDPVTNLPTETTSEVTTNVMVRDAETVAIGGLIETRDVRTESKVPVLGSLPGVGWLFSSEETEVERSEIIVLLTPYILENGEVHEDGRPIMERAEQDSRVLRDAMGPTSRVHMAGDYLSEAREALAMGRLDEARALCDRALKIDPLGEGVLDLSMEIDDALAEAGR